MSEHRLSVAACVVAAGQSSRMGKVNKLLTTINGSTLLQHVLNSIQRSAIDETCVITGYQSGQVRASISGFDIKLVNNDAYSSGLSTSIKMGVENLSEQIDGVLICLGDMPFVSANIINKIVDAFEQNGEIIVPTFLGQDGNPLLWPRSYFDKLINLQGDRGAKYLLREYSGHVHRLDVDNIGIVLDVDDAPALEFLRSKFNLKKGENNAN